MGAGRDGPPDLAELARDWITLYQSELAALASDRETQELWQAALALWATTATAILAPQQHDRARRRARATEAARSAPAAAASDARDAEVERLTRRVAELEQRLAELERAQRDGGAGRGNGEGG
jgi:ubiquinone biosynthesis protein UbiJ